MRISDWSSDVCSSDLLLPLVRLQTSRGGEAVLVQAGEALPPVLADRVLLEQVLLNLTRNAFDAMTHLPPAARRVLIPTEARSEERRVGQEWVSTCRSRGSPNH